MTSDVLDALYVAWLAVAVLVMLAVTPVIVRRVRRRRFDAVFWMAAGILLSWAGSGLTRAWFTIWREGWRHGYDSHWMADHWMIAVAGALVIAGAALHLRSFTVHRFGEWGWITSLIIVAAAAAGYKLAI